MKENLNTQRKLSKIIAQNVPMYASCIMMSRAINNRITVLNKHMCLHHMCSYHYRDKFSQIKTKYARTKRSIQAIMERASTFGLIDLNTSLKKMKDCCERIILCIKDVQLKSRKIMKKKKRRSRSSTSHYM